MIGLYTGLSDTWMIGLRRSIKLVVHLQRSLGCNAAVIACDMSGKCLGLGDDSQHSDGVQTG